MRNPHNEALSPDIAEGRKARASGPERRCILTGDNAPRDALVRLAISPEGSDGTSYVLPDALARAPGRGAWIGVTRDDLSTALANGKLKGALARARENLAKVKALCAAECTQATELAAKNLYRLRRRCRRCSPAWSMPMRPGSRQPTT